MSLCSLQIKMHVMFSSLFSLNDPLGHLVRRTMYVLILLKMIGSKCLLIEILFVSALIFYFLKSSSLYVSSDSNEYLNKKTEVACFSYLRTQKAGLVVVWRALIRVFFGGVWASPARSLWSDEGFHYRQEVVWASSTRSLCSREDSVGGWKRL